LAAGFDVFRKTDSSYTGFESENQGINLRLGAPITDELYLSTAFKYSQTKYSNVTLTVDYLGPSLLRCSARSPMAAMMLAALSYTLSYNTLDDNPAARRHFREVSRRNMQVSASIRSISRPPPRPATSTCCRSLPM
jgi:outer membrane protein insertion porin family